MIPGNEIADTELEFFSTCSSRGLLDGPDYRRRIAQVAQWSESAGFKGILIYTDNSQIDPWLVADIVLQHTKTLCPLIALQPVYMHPFAAAKMISSIAYLHGRRVFLNLVAGGYRNDLMALNDTTPHDRRYDRLVEYATIINLLLRAEGPVSFIGDFYTVENLVLSPGCPKEKLPGVFISGSSKSGLASAAALGATPIQYPKPVGEYLCAAQEGIGAGIRIGVISRANADEAWAAARTRFPPNRRGQLIRQLATRTSDSVWHHQLSRLAGQRGEHPYWLEPFENYSTMCPYLVGDYATVGRELAGYLALGYRTFITDVPANPEELAHIGRAFASAKEAHNRSALSDTAVDSIP